MDKLPKSSFESWINYCVCHRLIDWLIALKKSQMDNKVVTLFDWLIDLIVLNMSLRNRTLFGIVSVYERFKVKKRSKQISHAEMENLWPLLFFAKQTYEIYQGVSRSNVGVVDWSIVVVINRKDLLDGFGQNFSHLKNKINFTRVFSKNLSRSIIISYAIQQGRVIVVESNRPQGILIHLLVDNPVRRHFSWSAATSGIALLIWSGISDNSDRQGAEGWTAMNWVQIVQKIKKSACTNVDCQLIDWFIE